MQKVVNMLRLSLQQLENRSLDIRVLKLYRQRSAWGMIWFTAKPSIHIGAPSYSPLSS